MYIKSKEGTFANRLLKISHDLLEVSLLVTISIPTIPLKDLLLS